MEYLLQVSFVWIVFYLVYFIFLKKLTFFGRNRMFLNASLFLGLIIPAVAPYFEIAKPSIYVDSKLAFFSLVGNQVLLLSDSNLIKFLTDSSNFTLNNFLWTALPVIYLIVLLFCLSRFLFGLLAIRSLYLTGEKKRVDGITYVYNDKFFLPFSFFTFIFISNKLPFGDKINKVIGHETLHAKHWHSLDIICIEILRSVFWFNPILKLYKKSIQDAHEYLVDQLSCEGDKKNYIDILLKATSSDFNLHLTNSFFNSQIVKRVQMIKSERSLNKSSLRYLMGFPLIVIISYFFTSTPKYIDNNLGSIKESSLDLLNRDITILHNNKVINQHNSLIEYVRTNTQVKSNLSINKDKSNVVPFEIDYKQSNGEFTKSNNEISESELAIEIVSNIDEIQNPKLNNTGQGSMPSLVIPQINDVNMNFGKSNFNVTEDNTMIERPIYVKTSQNESKSERDTTNNMNIEENIFTPTALNTNLFIQSSIVLFLKTIVLRSNVDSPK
jgi:hypothetical protein